MLQKFKAFLLHFLLSGIVIFCFIGLIWFVWYPAPYLEAEGGLDILLLLIGVDLILGPMLTAVVYKKGKKSLVFDLSLIVLVQLLALFYGMNTLFQERPQYVAFVVDRFTLVPAASINTDDLIDKSLQTKAFDRARFVYIELEENPKIRSEILMETIYGGKGYPERPQYYRAIEDQIDAISQSDEQIRLGNILKKYPEYESIIDDLAASNSTAPDQLIFYPLKGKLKFMILVLDRNDLTVLAGLDIDPWSVPK